MDVRFGLIGLGKIAKRFAKNVNSSERAKLVSVAARSMDKAKEFAKEYGAQNAYDDYELIAKDKDVDIVYISLVHNLHYDAVKLCLNNGKAVICEKPLVLTAADAIEISVLAKEKNLLLMEATWTRCQPGFKKIIDWVDDNKIGKLKMIDASFCLNIDFNNNSRLYNKDTAGGALYDLGIYPIEFSIGIARSEVVSACGDFVLGKSGVDEYNNLTIMFENDIIANCKSSLSAWAPSVVNLYGDNGYIIVEGVTDAKKATLYDKERNVVECFEDDVEDAFIHEVNHIVGLFLNDKKESPLIPLKDSIECAKIFDLVLNSKLKTN